MVEEKRKVSLGLKNKSPQKKRNPLRLVKSGTLFKYVFLFYIILGSTYKPEKELNSPLGNMRRQERWGEGKTEKCWPGHSVLGLIALPILLRT